MLKAVIMDFDGLILDTEVIWYQIFAKWFKENKNYNLPVEEFLKCVGSNPESLFQYLEIKYNLKIDREEFLRDTEDQFLKQCQTLPPKEGVIDFVKSVKETGLKLSLATSGTRSKSISQLSRIDLLDYFDLIITGEDVKRIKPFPDLFLETIKRLEIIKSETIIFEDSSNGLIAGQKAGINVFLIPNEVTKYSNFENYFDKKESLKQVDIRKIISRYN